MRYLIIYNGTASYTQWFETENNYCEGMIVIDFVKDVVTFDGKTWKEIEEDNL